MAPTRPRQSTARVSYAESDSGGDTEREQTPRPSAHTHSKKRLSERDQDGSFSLDNNANASKGAHGRIPLTTVNINDDAAEKRRRRKSAKLPAPLDPSDDPEAGPSSIPAGGPSSDAPGAAEGSRGAGLPRTKSQMLSIPQTPAINLPKDVMAQNYDQWMKMATDNKINAANSWNFALIDYFHDMSLLRNNNDNSINFQRASCTLDGCVKIWTSRVDSVGTETGKLLSNLANRVDDGDDSDNPSGGDPSQSQKKRKAYRSESTLAKNPAQLRTKKLDLEFSVDPLFRKTCADFDEGGAQGLLMNHLGLTVAPDGSLRVVFDASDSVAKDEDEEEAAPLEEPREDMGLTQLRAQFMPNLDELDDWEISESLEDFAFGKDSFSHDDTLFTQSSQPIHDDDDDDDQGGFNQYAGFGDVMEVDGPSSSTAPAEDFFVGDQAVPNDFEFAPDYGAEGDGGSVHGSDGAPAEGQRVGPGGAFVPFDPRRMPGDRDLFTIDDAEGEMGVLNYFNTKNWAGPEHWKLRKIVRRPDASEAAASRPKREKKEAFRIDFLTPAEEDIKARQKRLFAPATRGPGINLPGPSTAKGRKPRGKKGKGKEDKRFDQTLPDDMHFSSKQLVTLFLKPKFSLKMRGQRIRTDGKVEDEIDEAFWARAAADKAAGPSDDALDPPPFNTQFFNDDDDDGPGFDDFDGATAAEIDESLGPMQASKRVKPEAVNYAKRAKRVDVRKLKENIWKGLDISAPAVEGEEDMETEERPPTDPDDGRSFTSVISGLQQSYTKDRMDEISTSFCFICLLHLANERGLKIEVDGKEEAQEDAMEVDPEDRKVGNLWDLKVYRDPNATPAS
ncbi:barren [Epithele typhae]|uniref:barren n=1 Tax=Epithele typhae TaxID=378194 RepID=UPI0020082DD5|nr:barren [Epithele typhae]KAH9940947.1 barren [Epithele typhae]